MELEIYHYSLCVSLTLLLFFSFRFLFGKLPDKQIFRQYRISRMLMGIALLDLAANYSVHLFLTPRLAAPINAILMNLCTYWLAVWLFGSALMMLLDKRYVTRKRFIRHIAGWMAYCIVVLILWCYVPSSLLYSIVPILLAAAFCVYAVGVAHKVLQRSARQLASSTIIIPTMLLYTFVGCRFSHIGLLCLEWGRVYLLLFQTAMYTYG